MLYCIQAWILVPGELPDWSASDALISLLENQFTKKSQGPAQPRSLPAQEIPPGRYHWTNSDGSVSPGVTFELRYQMAPHRNNLWGWAVGLIPVYINDGTVLRGIFSRHDCSHETPTSPEGVPETMEIS